GFIAVAGTAVVFGAFRLIEGCTRAAGRHRCGGGGGVGVIACEGSQLLALVVLDGQRVAVEDGDGHTVQPGVDSGASLEGPGSPIDRCGVPVDVEFALDAVAAV